MQHHLSKAAQENINTWLTEPKYAEYKEELEQLIAQEDWKTLEDSFFTIVPFGTGGRRGTVGIGSNRINRVTIGESAQGLANYLVEQGNSSAELADHTVKQMGIVIAHDTRTTSREFAEYVASITTANGFTTYLFDSFRATPELSFAVRHLNAAAGIVISASHNPPADNGFKAYWNDGGQIVPPHDKGIMEAVGNVTEIKTTTTGDIVSVGKDVDDAYIAAITQESMSVSRTAKIAYSPLHGTGTMSVKKVLEHAGFTDVTIVEEQATPDGTFPNLPNNIPNPEVPSASEMVTEYAKRLHADIAITTDPDADRLGVVAPDIDDTYKLLTGNQIAALAAYHVASRISPPARGGVRGGGSFVVRTIVTTDLLDAIAQDFGLKIYNHILIGFKYVAQLIREHQDNGNETFVLGGEESYGLLKGSYCRDKDAAVAALLLCEMTSELKDQGKTLLWQLDELYKKYGVFTETLNNISYPGAEGFQNMQKIMKQLRENPPLRLSGFTGQAPQPILRVIDREKFEGTEKGNVLIFELSEDHHNRLTIRPSGTEPKIKIYTQLHTPVDPSISEEDLRIKKSEEQERAKQLTDAFTKLVA